MSSVEYEEYVDLPIEITPIEIRLFELSAILGGDTVNEFITKALEKRMSGSDTGRETFPARGGREEAPDTLLEMYERANSWLRRAIIQSRFESDRHLAMAAQAAIALRRNMAEMAELGLGAEPEGQGNGTQDDLRQGNGTQDDLRQGAGVEVDISATGKSGKNGKKKRKSKK